MMTYRTISLWLLCAAICLGTARAQAEEACPASSPAPVSLPATKKRLASQAEVVIVALGSSSTQGWRATSPSNTYPARLQADLGDAYPGSHVAVINRGIGGQDATEEMARLEADAIAVRPSLVIWQVGANGAMARSDPEVFRKLVSAGIERMKQFGIDIILMDNQRAPMILASPSHLVLERILGELAAKYDISLFSRGALMDQWKQNGLEYGHFLSDDNVHMNDLGYRCLASALASSIKAGLSQPARAESGPTVRASK